MAETPANPISSAEFAESVETPGPAGVLPTSSNRSQRNHGKNRSWVWYFVIVVALSILATVIIIGYNLAQQLTSEQLHAAMQKWQDNGPRDYELQYVVKRSGSNEPDQYVVKVKEGMVVSATLNKYPLKYHQLENHSMTQLLKDIQAFMEKDAEAGTPWTFTRALFDEKDGHLLWYVRRVMGSRERVEIEVKEFKVLSP
jgi:hypothetical protein